MTRRKQAEADTLFLLDLGEGIRFAADADELLWAVAVALGEHLKASRCGFVEIDTDRDQLTVQRDYHPHVPSLVGTYPLTAFSSGVIEAAASSGQIIAIADIHSDERTAQDSKAYHKHGARGLVLSPLLRDGSLVSALVVATGEATNGASEKLHWPISSLNARGWRSKNCAWIRRCARAMPRCATPIGAKTSSWQPWPMSCAIRCRSSVTSARYKIPRLARTRSTLGAGHHRETSQLSYTVDG